MQAIVTTLAIIAGLFFAWLATVPDYVKAFYEYVVCDSQNRAYDVMNKFIDKLPDLSSISSSVNLPGNVVYMAEMFNLPFGLATVSSAYILRFWIRFIRQKI